MKKVLALILVFCLFGCGTTEYYKTLQRQYEADAARAMQLTRAIEQARAKPLVSHTWTDSDGTEHSIVINQPMLSNLGQVNQRSQRSEIPAPWTPWLAGAGKLLDAGVAMMPVWQYMLGAFGGSATEINATDGSMVLFGDNSSHSAVWDASSTVTTVTETITETVTGAAEGEKDVEK